MSEREFTGPSTSEPRGFIVRGFIGPEGSLPVLLRVNPGGSSV